MVVNRTRVARAVLLVCGLSLLGAVPAWQQLRAFAAKVPWLIEAASSTT